MHKVQKDLIEKIDGKYPYYFDSGHLIINGDCLEVVELLEDKSINVVLTDPPYFQIVKNKWDCQWRTIQDFSKWSGMVGSKIRNKLTDNGSFYWFGDDKNIAYCQVELDKYFRLLNNIVWKKPELITKKGAYSVFRSYAPTTERILFYDKGESKTGLEMVKEIMPNPFGDYLKDEILKGFKTFANFRKYIKNELKMDTAMANRWFDCDCLMSKEVYKKIRNYLNSEYLRKEYEDLRRYWSNDKDALDVLEFSFYNEKEKFHPTHKPIDLIMYMLDRVTKKDFIVLDLFGGSCTTAIASRRLKVNSICIELDKEYYKKSCERLKKECDNLMLF